MTIFNATLNLIKSIAEVLDGTISKTLFIITIIVFFLYIISQKIIMPKLVEISHNTIFSYKENISFKNKYLRLLALLSTMVFDLLMLIGLIIFLRIMNFYLKLQTTDTQSLYYLSILFLIAIMFILAQLVHKTSSAYGWNVKSKTLLLLMLIITLLLSEAFYISYAYSNICFKPIIVKIILLVEMTLFSSIEYILLMKFKSCFYTCFSVLFKIIDNVAFFIPATSYIVVVFSMSMVSKIYDVIYIITIILGIIETILAYILIFSKKLVETTVYSKNSISTNVIKIKKEKDFICIYGTDKLRSYIRIKDVFCVKYEMSAKRQDKKQLQIVVHCQDGKNYIFDDYGYRNTIIGYYTFKKYKPCSIEYTMIFDDRIKFIESKHNAPVYSPQERSH